MCWSWFLLGHVHLNLCQKHKLRVANEVNNPFYGPDPTLGIVYFSSWKSYELRVAIMRNALESGVEITKREKEQKQSDSRISWKKVKKKKNIQEIQARKEESHLHKWRKKGNNKVKEYGKLGKIKWWKVEGLVDRSRREKKSLSIPKYTLPDPEPMLQAKKVLSLS